MPNVSRLLVVGAVALAGSAFVSAGLIGSDRIEAAELGEAASELHAEVDAESAALYAQLCAACHGAEYQGGSAHGFLEYEWKHGDSFAEVRRSIAQGIPQFGMPEYGSTLTDAQLDGLTRLVMAPPTDGSRPPAPELESRGSLTTRDYEVNVEAFIADGLERPWAIAFIDERTALITEQPGRLRVVDNGVLRAEPVADVPDVLFSGQGGMMDVAIDPEYGDGTNDWIYLAYTHATGGRNSGAMTRVVRGKITGNRWTDEQVVFEARKDDYIRSRFHFGTRIDFDADGHLYFTIGDRGVRDGAQQLDKPNGKVHRVNRDGSIPSDNPFVGRGGGVYESVYSYGHRNAQGLVIDRENNRIWSTEHGPRGGDELNLVKPALNYGWPVITYGINYNGSIITDETHRDGMEQPTVYWTPSTAVCGLALYTDGPFERWHGNLLSGGLVSEEVRRIVLHEDRVIHQEVILQGRGRVRDVTVGPDGAIYVVINQPAEVLRLSPKGRTRH